MRNNDKHDLPEGPFEPQNPNPWVYGDDGHNTLRPNLDAHNWLYGGGGNDILHVSRGPDYLNGADGFDFVFYLGGITGVTVNLATGRGTSGSAAGDLYFNIEGVYGTNQGDTIIGHNQGVRLHGWGGNDRLTGGAAMDWFDGGSGADRIDGRGGWDVASYLATPASAGGVTIDMKTNANGGAARGDTLIHIEAVQGTNSADTIVGMDRGNGNGVGLYGEGGDDNLIGKAGSDHLSGGTGNDILAGGAGNDFLTGGEGDDAFFFTHKLGGNNIDTIRDFSKDDTIWLYKEIFTNCETGRHTSLLSPGNLGGKVAKDSSDHILWNSDARTLSYDPDGNGAASAVVFAVLDTSHAITAYQIHVI
jgi:Ca2+-binding RTX toxin-like protein